MCVLGIFAPMMLGSTTLGWLCPYCWAAKLAEPLMKTAYGQYIVEVANGL